MSEWNDLTPEQKKNVMKFADYLFSDQFAIDSYNPDDATPEETDAYLRAHGYDPDEIVERMRKRINEILEKQKHYDDGWDGLRTCSTCGDRYTTSESGVCDSCQQQAWIDAHG